jgi:hypothetical protein
VGNISADDEVIRSAASDLDTAYTTLKRNPRARGSLKTLGSPEKITPLVERARVELRNLPVSNSEWQYFIDPQWERPRDALIEQVHQLHSTWSNLTSTFNPAFLTEGDYSALIQVANAATHGVIGRKKR